MNTDDPILLLSGEEKRIQAPSFLPFPISMFSYEDIGEITWEDVLKYLFY